MTTKHKRCEPVRESSRVNQETVSKTDCAVQKILSRQAASRPSDLWVVPLYGERTSTVPTVSVIVGENRRANERMSGEFVILGAGGHAKVLHSLLHRSRLTVVGLVAPPGLVSIAGLSILGDDDWLAAQSPQRYRLVNGIGSVASTTARRLLFTRFQSTKFEFPPLIDPDARVDEDTELGAATQIFRCAVVQPGVRIGNNSIVNTGAIVDHDCRIADHVHVATGCTLSGGVQVGEGTHIGSGAVVKQNVRIGKDCVIGAGSVVVSDIADGSRAWGAPARRRD